MLERVGWYFDCKRRFAGFEWKIVIAVQKRLVS